MDVLTGLPEGTQFAIQICVVLLCLFYGARRGGMALGLLGGVGLFVLAFLFGIRPGAPAVSVMLTILAVVVASATLQASGGLDVMLQFAERVLRFNPRFLTILAPFVTFFLTVLCGTGHVVYTMMPIIYDIAIKNGIRPERPMAAASVTSQMGIIASPVSVAVVSLSALLLGSGQERIAFDGPLDLLAITVPSSLCGVLAVGIFSLFRGRDLEHDEYFQEGIKIPAFRDYVYGGTQTLLGRSLPAHCWRAMWIFLATIAIVALLGAVPELRPSFGGGDGAQRLGMVEVIQMFMLICGTALLACTPVDLRQASSNEIFRSGMVALVAVFGISWMADTMFAVHTPMMKEVLGSVVAEHPWSYAVMLLLISKFVNSQAAAIAAFVPLALAIHVDPAIIIAFAPACYGYYILPTYPSDLATIQFDRSGTTRIGRFVINHSFILPGLIGVGTSCACGWLLADLAL